ncbi:dipeptide ABC transporter ATP-binding protein [Mycolicibacterium parafortuitum]|uniref:ABC transporter-like protein [Thermobispora bispora DSM] n=1 Tax=Mycolicibacterium parafortuitum TaxID=39692 RepID=A0A375YGG0_MYCPF|nr:ABC transporter ATP-binding protein [Mycolicibacterium parafortuitum]SRX80208.1 ABC transporter-like protein [Thermobispora bispora DSM] [Mycolicibacterium parafortuitum]
MTLAASDIVTPPRGRTGDVLVEVAGLTVSFDSVRAADGAALPVVSDVDFTLRRGRVLAIVGESGSGKSVTARTLVGLAGAGSRIEATTLDIHGADARGYRDKDWRRVRGAQIGFVLQDALTSLDPLRTVQAEVAEALRVPRRERVAAVEELLDSVGIPDPPYRRKNYPHQLSGGLRQRALIASALAGHPDVLIADEPTTALDVTVQARILALLRTLADDGRAVLLISHDLAVVSRVADDVIVMHNGRVVERGQVADVIGNPQHDYTRRLVAAVPGRDTRGRRLSDPEAPAPQPVPIGPQVVADIAGVGKFYRQGRRSVFTAAADVTFAIRRAEIVGLVGESGSGKSTVARIVTGLLTPDAGHVEIDGRRWTGRRGHEGPRLGAVQLVAQDSVGSFDPRYTVREIIAETVALGHHGRAERDARIRELLDLVHLPAGVIDRHPRSLSGGQRQRVSIARALGSDPDLLVCDEAVSALDVSIQTQILDLLLEIRAARNTALLFISHDIGVVHHVADRVLVMHRGRVVEEGTADEVFDTPRDPYTQALLKAVPTL